MQYVVTFKGLIEKIKFDNHTERCFYDLGNGYFDVHIDAKDEDELSNEIDIVKQGGRFKVIGIDW